MTDTTTLRADLAAMERRAATAEAKLAAVERANAELFERNGELLAKVQAQEGFLKGAIAAGGQGLAELRAAESALAELRGEVVVLRRALEKADLFIKRTRSLIETVDRVAEKQGDDEFVWFYNLPSGPWHACLAVARDQSPTDAALTATPMAAALGALVEAALAWHESLGKPTKEQIHYICNTSEKGLAVLYACAAADAVLAAMGKEGANNAETGS